MDLIVLTENEFLFTLIDLIVAENKVNLIHLKNRAELKNRVCESSCLGILLDFPKVEPDDFKFWRELMTIQSIPILVINIIENEPIKELIKIKSLLSKITHPLVELLEFSKTSRKNVDPLKIQLTPHVVFNVGEHCIIKNGEQILLSTIEFKLLYLLVTNLDTSFTSDELIDHLGTTGPGVLYVYIKKIRNKIEDNSCNPKILVNERGKGYCLKQQSEPVSIIN